MNIEAYWENSEQTALIFSLQGNWQWTALFEQIDRATEMIRCTPYGVSIILDLHGRMCIPGGDLWLPDNFTHLQNLLNRNRTRRSPIIVVGADQTARMIYHTLRLIDMRMGWQVYFTGTLEEAHCYLRCPQSKPLYPLLTPD